MARDRRLAGEGRTSLSTFALVAANTLFWPVIQLAVARWATARPLESFDPRAALYRARSFERRPGFYRRWLRIEAWKGLLPDGAAWFEGGFPKARLASSDPAYLGRFRLETCRGEWAHWVMLGFAPAGFLWNPAWAGWVMLGFGIALNLPCLIVLRHCRFALERVLEKRERLQARARTGSKMRACAGSEALGS